MVEMDDKLQQCPKCGKEISTDALVTRDQLIITCEKCGYILEIEQYGRAI